MADEGAYEGPVAQLTVVPLTDRIPNRTMGHVALFGLDGLPFAGGGGAGLNPRGSFSADEEYKKGDYVLGDESNPTSGIFYWIATDDVPAGGDTPTYGSTGPWSPLGLSYVGFQLLNTIFNETIGELDSNLRGELDTKANLPITIEDLGFDPADQAELESAVSAAVSSLTQELNAKASKTELTDGLALKSDKTTTDTALAAKANAADVYAKTAIDDFLAAKASTAAVVDSLALKRNIADSYSKTEVDGKIPKKLTAYSPTETYATGDVVVYQGDIYQANKAVVPNTPVTYVGRTYDGTNSTIALPAGSAAGDVVLLTHSNQSSEAPATPAGWTALSGFPKYGSGRAGIHAYIRTLTAADISAGNVSKAATNGDIRVYRGAATPTMQSGSPQTVLNPPGFSVPTGAMVLRTVVHGWYTGNEISGPPTIANNVADVGTYFSAGYARGVGSAHLTGRPVANGDGVSTAPPGGGTLPFSVDLIFAPVTGFQSSQWDKKVNTPSYSSNEGQVQQDSLISNRSILTVSAVGSPGSPTASGQPARSTSSEDIIIPTQGNAAYVASDQRSVVKIVADTTSAAGNVMLMLRTRGANALNALGVYFSGVVNEGMYIFSRTNGSWGSSLGNFAQITQGTPANAPRWLVAQVVGNNVLGEVWDGDPDVAGSNKIAVCNATLSGAEATNHGAGVVGSGGIRWGGAFGGAKFISQWRWASKDPQNERKLVRIERDADGVLTLVLADDSRLRLTKDIPALDAAPAKITALEAKAVSRAGVVANYTATATDSVVGVTSTSAARTITLPSAASYPQGKILHIKDESGAAATNNITVVRAGTDTIESGTSAVISTNYGSIRLYSDGASKWFLVNAPDVTPSGAGSADNLTPVVVPFWTGYGTVYTPPANLILFHRFTVQKPIMAKSISFFLWTASDTENPLSCGIYEVVPGTQINRIAYANKKAGKLVAPVGTKNIVFDVQGMLYPGRAYYTAWYLPPSFAGTAPSVEAMVLPGTWGDGIGTTVDTGAPSIYMGAPDSTQNMPATIAKSSLNYTGSPWPVVIRGDQ